MVHDGAAATGPEPEIGMSVLYESQIGQTLPAVIVALSGRDNMVNLQVFRDDVRGLLYQRNVPFSNFRARGCWRYR